MTKLVRHFIYGSALLLSAVAAPVSVYAAAGIPPAGKESGFADLAAKLIPSVVNVSSTVKMAKAQDLPQMPQLPPGSPFQDFFDEFMNQPHNMGPMSSLGSGFIVDADKGYIVTNYHVVKDAENVRITLYDDSTLDAKLVGSDEKMDLAVLKVETKKKLTAVSFGDSDKLRVGDWILAIGNPFGLGGTVTAGIVSAQQRNINAGPYDDFIQTDASINRGNSGGPMFNLDGEVIGINTAIFSPSGGSVGIGFAIPSNLSKPYIMQLIEHGHTQRGWLGVRIQNVTEEIAESLRLPEASGALVAVVTPTGPADKAGLRTGDIILEVDGRKISAMRTLPRLIAETPMGKKIKLTYWRDGKKAETTATVGALEKAEKDGLLGRDETPSVKETAPVGKETIESVGLTLGKLTPAMRKQFDVPSDIKGVLVTETALGSESAEKGLGAGDVIIEVNQQEVAEPQDVTKAIASAQKEGRNSVLLLVQRESDTRFVALRLKK